MITTKTLSNHYKYQLGTAKINYMSDVFKLILLNESFVFNKDSHGTYSNILSSELSTGNGYTVGGITLEGVSLETDNELDRFIASWDNVVVSALGGSIGPFKAAAIIDMTTTDDTVVACIEIESPISILNGQNRQFENISSVIA